MRTYFFENTSCYILAGGKSSRMGQDKGLMPIPDKTMVHLLTERVQSVFPSLKIVANNPAYNSFGYPVITDLKKDVGPAGGIHAALADSVHEQIFILSCDMPFVTLAGINHLMGYAENHDIVLPHYKGNAEPLFAMLNKRCLPLWTLAIDRGIFKLQDIMANFNTLSLDVTTEVIFDKDFFFNVNTPEALEIAKQKLMK